MMDSRPTKRIMALSISECLLVLFVGLLVIKPDQLPEVMQQLGRLVRSVRQMVMRLQSEMQGLLNTVDNTDEQKHKRQS